MKNKKGKSGTFLYSFRKVKIKEDKIKLTKPDTIESFHKITLIVSEKYIVMELI